VAEAAEGGEGAETVGNGSTERGGGDYIAERCKNGLLLLLVLSGMPWNAMECHGMPWNAMECGRKRTPRGGGERVEVEVDVDVDVDAQL
jgi:hypothetical protein